MFIYSVHIPRSPITGVKCHRIWDPDTYILPTSFLKGGHWLGIFSLSGEPADFLNESNCFPLPLAMHGTGAQKSILHYLPRPYDQNQSCHILEEKRERSTLLYGKFEAAPSWPVARRGLQMGGEGPGLPETHRATENQLFLRLKVVSGTC